MKKKRRIIFKIVLILVFTPVLLVGFIQTPVGKSLLSKSISTLLSKSENLNIRIGTVRGLIPLRVDISEVELSDGEGIWLTVKDLHFNWTIRELINERFQLKSLNAAELELHRFPKSVKGKMDVQQSDEGFDLIEIRVDGLQINKLVLDKQVAGMQLNYSVLSGGISLLTTGRLSGDLQISGDAEGLVGFDASLVGNGKDQLTLVAELEHMHNPTFGFDALSGQGRATVSSSGVEGHISATLEKGVQKGTVSTDLHYAELDLQLNEFEFDYEGASAFGNLGLTFKEGGIAIELESGLLSSKTNRFDVSGTAWVGRTNGHWAADIDSLLIEGLDVVSVEFAGSLTPSFVNLTGELAPFILNQIPLKGITNFTGQVTGRLDVQGALDDPQVWAAIEVMRFANSEDALDEFPEVDFQIEGSIAAGTISCSSSMNNLSHGHFSGSLSAPCTFSVVPFRFNYVLDDLEGEVEADLDLDFFNSLSALNNQVLEGILEAEMAYSNQMASGHMAIVNGRYEHYDWGLVFHDLEALLMAKKGGFVVEYASGSDGGSGKLDLSGGFDLDGLDLQLKLDGARVVQRPEAEVEISGQLDVGGRTFRPDITGKLIVDHAEILLDNIVKVKPPVLNDFNINTTNTVVQHSEKKRFPYTMDVDIELRDQVYIAASIIDSVWGGRLRVRKTPKGLSVSGSVDPARGYMSFVGEKFRFTRVGEVVFEDSVPTSMVFNNLTAEHSRSGIIARLIINGRASNPSIILESEPPLPEDEVLSQVLFNRSTESITPYQAYQIAAAAQQLSGGLLGPGYIYQFRQAIGVDTLEWREGETKEDGSSVAAGKYITPALYIEVNSSFGAKAETGMTAEYEITRHFSVETSAGPKMRPGVGVNWKNDY